MRARGCKRQAQRHGRLNWPELNCAELNGMCSCLGRSNGLGPLRMDIAANTKEGLASFVCTANQTDYFNSLSRPPWRFLFEPVPSATVGCSLSLPPGLGGSCAILCSLCCSSSAKQRDARAYTLKGIGSWPHCTNIKCIAGRTPAEMQSACDGATGCTGSTFTQNVPVGDGCLKDCGGREYGGCGEGGSDYWTRSQDSPAELEPAAAELGMLHPSTRQKRPRIDEQVGSGSGQAWTRPCSPRRRILELPVPLRRRFCP
jgi:hypothetical protein